MEAYFSRVELPAAAMIQGDYGLHQALWHLFSDGPDRERDFLFHQRTERPNSCFVVSRRPPQLVEGWALDSREYQPQLQSGHRLAFALRANPTVARGREGRHSTRHDVIFDARRQAKVHGTTLSVAEAEQQAGRQWLERRAEACGFVIDAVRITGYERKEIRKRRRKEPPVVVSRLDYEGILYVADPERFLHTLLHGVGPAKAFGCGLLLVRRV